MRIWSVHHTAIEIPGRESVPLQRDLPLVRR
jgi:hypothetical protein